ncbi:MAG: hypothetical protein ACFE7E_04405 [Candidatus Hodarchaeota archaeon]
MVKIRSADRIKKEIVKRYNSSPRGWQVMVRRDLRGHYDLIFTKDSNIWFVKEEFINPYKSVGLGAKQTIGRKLDVDNPFEFGLRPLSQEQMRTLIEILQKGSDLGRISKIIEDVEPTSARKIDTPYALQGPVIRVDRHTGLISEKQRELDQKLRIELEKLLRKKYPHLLRSYT